MNLEKNGSEDLEWEEKLKNKELMILELLKYFKPKYSKNLMNSSINLIRALYINIHSKRFQNKK